MTFLRRDLFEHKKSELYNQVIHRPYRPRHGLLSFMNAEKPMTMTISLNIVIILILI